MRDQGSAASQQLAAVFVPPHQCGFVAFPHATVAAPAAARGGLGRRFAEIVSCLAQALLKLGDALAYRLALGLARINDGVFVLGHETRILTEISCRVSQRLCGKMPR